MSANTVAVDLGGTKITAGLVSPEGRVSGLHTIATPAAAGPAAVLDAVAGVVDSVTDDASVPAVGVGTAGLVDVERGLIVSATDAMPGWPGTRVADGLSRRLAGRWGSTVPVHLQNDVDAHALGEAWLGAGRGLDPVLLVTVGTGVGAGLVINGQAHRGAHSAGGEFGHLPAVGAEGLRCPCGRLGHLEAVASGVALASRWTGLTGEALDGQGVVTRAVAGDERATGLVTDAAVALGRGIAGLVTVVDPAVVIIGGGVAQAGPLWWGPMETTLRSELIDLLCDVRMVPAELGAEAALVGAGWSARSLLPRERTDCRNDGTRN
ncbi:MAG: ROK family protein [Propionibacteriales bacterium]|nr:ROK family protein [Propionibacteriales bacterium]